MEVTGHSVLRTVEIIHSHNQQLDNFAFKLFIYLGRKKRQLTWQISENTVWLHNNDDSQPTKFTFTARQQVNRCAINNHRCAHNCHHSLYRVCRKSKSTSWCYMTETKWSSMMNHQPLHPLLDVCMHDLWNSQCFFDHIWSCLDANFWLFDPDCSQLHLCCKFAEIPTSSQQRH